MGRPPGTVNFDLTGKTFGRLTVLYRKGSSKHGAPLWLCQCSCGNRRLNQSSTLRHGIVVSCGCFHKEMTAKLRLIHGQSRTKTYRCWANMVQRCTNPNNHHYYLYGGRGIKIVKRWMKFKNFFSDMGACPIGLSIDRIDNNGPYSPWNCRWATKGQQISNKRKERKIRSDKGKSRK